MTEQDIYKITKAWIDKDHENPSVDWVKLMANDLASRFQAEQEAYKECMERVASIEILELGQPKSLIQRENEPITELIDTNLLVEELNQALRIHHVAERGEQLLALAQYMFEHQNNYDGKKAKDYLKDFLRQ